VLSTCDLFFYSIFPTVAVGNPQLDEEAMEAVEVGYVGTSGKTTVSVSLYRNELEGSTDFFQAGFYTSTNPPPNWPLFLAGQPVPVFPPQLDGLLVSRFSYRNIGNIVNEGVELSVNSRFGKGWRMFANYTYQSDPEATGIDEDEINKPPNNRFNLGLSYDAGKWFVNGNVNYTDEAFWTDVLDSRFWGTTEDFTIANLSFGARFNNDKVKLTVIGTNLFDEDFQSHIFGDVIPRKVSAELRFTF
jgi:outer membrane cobalamin receptor